MQYLFTVASCSEQRLLLWEMGPDSGGEVFPIVSETRPQWKTVARCWGGGRERVMNEELPVHGPRDSAASQPQNGAALHLKHPSTD
jgi:hypothetical protein